MSYQRPNGRSRQNRPATAHGQDDVLNLLQPVLRNDSDITYSARTAAGDHFVAYLSQCPPYSGRPDVFSIYGKELELAFCDLRAPATYKQKVVKCVAAIGSYYCLDNRSQAFVHWICDRMLSPSSSAKSKDSEKDAKNWLLATLREFVEGVPARTTVPDHHEAAVAHILVEMQSFVDTMDSAEYMPKTLDLFQCIAENYPEQFSISFKDIIDLLVGWSIDPTLPRNMSALISDTFKKLWPFWMKHINFALELARHLLSDVDTLVNLQSEPGNTNVVESVPRKANGRAARVPNNAFILIRCLQSILYVVTYSGFPTLNAECEISLESKPVHFKVYLHVVEWCLNILHAVAQKYEDRTWLGQAYGFLKFLSKAFGKTFRPYHPKALDIMMLDCKLFTEENVQNKQLGSIAEKDLMEWLGTFSEITEQWLPHLSTPLFPSIIRPSESSLLREFRWACLRYPLCTEKLHAVLSKLFYAFAAADTVENGVDHANSSTGEELIFESLDIFHHLKGEESVSILAANDDLTTPCEIQLDSIFDGRAESARYAHHLSNLWRLDQADLCEVFLDDIRLICEAAQLGIEGFPRDASLLLLCRLVTERRRLSNSPSFLRNVNGHVLLAAYTLAWSHQFLISYFTKSGESNDIRTLALVSQFRAIQVTIQLEDISYNEKQIAVIWFHELLTAFTERCAEAGQILFVPAADVAREVEICISGFQKHLALDEDPTIREELAAVWMSYGRWISIYYLHDSPQVFHARLGVVHGVALKRLDDVDPSVRSSYFNLLASTHPANGIADSKVFHGVPTVDTMAVPPSGTFRAKHFQLMTSYLGMQERILKGDESTTPFCPDPENFEWLRRLYHSCHSCSFDESTHGKPADNRSEMESSLSFLMFWGLWESARYCVLSRLRTPFGSPLQTFEAIEGSLKDAIATHISDSESSQVRSAEGSQSLRGHIRELQHLISFIDLLEIQTQNACEGSLQCASAPRSSIAFFHTNKKSCEEWFARVRKLLVQGAHLTGSSAVLIKHALQYLAENAPSRASASRERNFTIADTDDVLRFLADELISIKEPDMLVGIKQWLEQIGLTKPETVDEKGAQKVTLLKRTVLNDDFTSIEWCCVNHLLAEGRYEAALPALIRGHEIVRKSIGGTSGRIRNLERWYEKHITQIYLGLQNWNEMQDWLDIVRDACGEDESNASMYRRTGHHEAALRQWAQLSQRPSEQEQGEERQDYSLKNIDPAMDHGFLTAAFSISEAYIVDQLAGLQAFGEIRSVSHNPNVSRVLGDALTLSISDNPLAVPRLSMQAHLIYLIKHSLDETPPPRWNVGSTRALDASDADPLSLNLLRDTIDVLDSLASPDERRSGREAIELTVCKLARKRENFAFAMRMYQRDPDQRGQFSDGQRFEFAKLEFARGKRKEGMKALISLISNQAVSHPQSIPPPLAAKALVRLAQWIMSSPRDIWSDSDLSMALASVCGPATEVPGIVSKSKEVVENCMQQLLSKATEESKSSAKAWYKLASHAYRAARKAAEAATGPLKSHENECSSRMREISLSLSAAAPTSNEETLKSLYSLMSAELQDLPAAHGEARAERHVREAYPHASPESIREATALITAQRTAILSQLGVAATAYFKYLDVVNSKGAHVQHGNGVTAALRILRLFLKYAPLRKELAPLFSSTPIGSWESIVPQLHARIDHPDVLVREILTDLMGRIGSVTPHLIVYHALADASIDKAQDYNPSTRILNKLQHDTSDMLVPQMQRLVKELRRITVFWEETWVHKLSHLQADAMKRLQRIEGEIRRVRCSATLSDTEKERLVREYYKTIMKPLVGALESLHESTCSTVGTTAHERWFQNTFGGRINDALKMLKEPEDLSLPKKTWQPFRDIYADLNRELQRSRQLKLSDVSPYLAKFRNSVVPMPGLSLHGGNVTIQSFAADIQILPTKTKPKKIQLLGSNGVRYTYLFKGNEDLHLDERIQQLLGIINLFLTADRPSGQRNMRARTYAVIPCGPRFGMIQWVENVTPFFTLYKRWQQRDYTAKLLQRKEGETGPEIPAPLRPHEQFHAKIGQALQRHGLTSKAPRREWPQSAMKEAFQKLQHETPANLVSRELFCGSPSASSWWEKTKAFSRSTAVMSMIGYIIGLGDRHLDNILLDHTNGEVVHIDYNVCFENGAKLRVPETVPFRLTQNFHSALGVTGTEGIYSVASEHVTRVMRDNRETLLTLLEAFVYDPLVDWTRNTSDDVNRKQSEINVNIGVLASRVAEKRDTIEENVYALLAACNDAEASVRASFPKQQAQEVIRSPQDLDAALADITTKRTECEMWATRHTRALLSLKGPILQACASEVFNLETGGTFPPVAPTAYMLGPSEAHMMRCVEVDQELFRVGSEKRDCYQRCLKHLQLYRALAAPIAEPLLEQDHFLQWSRLLQSVLEAPEDLSTYEHVYSYSFEEGLTAHTRKAALEAVMKSTCLAKDIEWQKARENVEALQEGTGADAMESFSAIFGTDGSYKNSDVVVNCFLLGELADLGRLLFAWIKEPEGAADITSEIACNVKSTAEKAVAIFGFYSFEPDNLHNVHALITYASMSAGIMQQVVADIGPTASMLSPQILQPYIDLSACLRDMTWHVTEALVPELILLLSKSDQASIAQLIGELNDICVKTASHPDQTSQQFQRAALNSTREFKALCARYSLQSQRTLHAVLSCFSSVFGPISTAIQNLLGQKDSAESSIIHNVLAVQQISFVQHAISACDAYFRSSEMEVDDPTHEWASNFDFRDIMQEHDCFVTVTSSLKKYFDICLREVLMKPLAKLFGKTIKRIAGPMAKARGSTPRSTGIPFVDTALDAMDAALEDRSDVEPTLRLMKGWHSHQCLPAVTATMYREGCGHIMRCDARMQQRKLALYRYQLLHESALTYPARQSLTAPTTNPRWQFMKNIGEEIPSLMQLSNDLMSIERNCRMTEIALEPLVKWARQDLALVDAVESYEKLGIVRHDQIAVESKRVTSMIDLCSTLLHFESFRVPDLNTQAMDDEIRGLIRSSEPQRETTLNAKPESVRQPVEEALVTLKKAYDDAAHRFEDVHHIISSLMKMSENVSAAQALKEDLQEHMSKWKEIVSLVNVQLPIAKASCLDGNQVEAEPGSLMLSILESLRAHAQHCLKSMCAFASLKELQINTNNDNGDPDEGRTIGTPFHLAMDPQGSPDAEEEMDARSLDAMKDRVAVDEADIPLKSVSPQDSFDQLPVSGELLGDEGVDAMSSEPSNHNNHVEQIGEGRTSGPKGQERNAYAVGVLQRIKAKLDGRESSEQQKLSVSEQVDRVIGEAVNIDRLAMMYEGWMGWI